MDDNLTTVTIGNKKYFAEPYIIDLQRKLDYIKDYIRFIEEYLDDHKDILSTVDAGLIGNKTTVNGALYYTKRISALSKYNCESEDTLSEEVK